jgi:P4 family phage/plasmid primase-like protien
MTNRMDALTDHNSEDTAADTLLDQLARAHTSESRAADIVADGVIRGAFRFSPALDWLVWDGCRWDSEEGGEEVVKERVRLYLDGKERDARADAMEADAEIQTLAKAILAREGTTITSTLPKDAAMAAVDEHGTEDEKALYNAAYRRSTESKRQADMWLNLLGAAKIASVVKLCRGMEGILTKAKELDQHPDLLNCTNGIVDLRTGELSPSEPDMLFTKVAGGAYDPAAEHETFTKALEAVHPDVVSWFQSRMGQTMTGRTPDDDSLVISAGGGENGKTAVMSAMMRAAGDYGRLISHKVLIALPGQHPTELMDLRGLRFALLEETPEEGRLDTHQLKTTIGTPQITARHMRQNSVTFNTTHTLWVNTNFLPQVDTTDHGTWRRLKAMPWPFKFRKAWEECAEDNHRAGDPDLKRSLMEDEGVAEAVLAWMVRGSIAWYSSRGTATPDPADVEDATSNWRASTDVGFQFAQERLVAAEGHFITAEVMRREFEEYLAAQGKKGWSAQTFNTRFPESLGAARIAYDKTPLDKTKVRVNDTESRPSGGAWGAAKPDVAAGKVIRMWRGVRFRTAAEQGGALHEAV